VNAYPSEPKNSKPRKSSAAFLAEPVLGLQARGGPRRIFAQGWGLNEFSPIAIETG
jgi:hypothetical protein